MVYLYMENSCGLVSRQSTHMPEVQKELSMSPTRRMFFKSRVQPKIHLGKAHIGEDFN